MRRSREESSGSIGFGGYPKHGLIVAAMPYNGNVSDLIAVDPDVLGGTPVFKGTRVPVRTLFEYLEENYTLEQFITCFPSVSRDVALAVLAECETALLNRKTA